MLRIALSAGLILALVPLGVRAQSSATSSGQVIAEQRISGQRIATLAATELANAFHDADRDPVPVSVVPDQMVSRGRVAMHAGTPIGTTAFVNVPVEIDVDGRADRTIMVGYRMQQFVQTAVAAHDIVTGTVLAPEDLTIARVPYTGVPGNGVDALVGRKVYSSFERGQPISIQATVVNQIVQAGSTVMFVILDSGVAVSSDAVARTGGGLGDQVYVYNPSTHKALSGTVTGPGTVELDISGGDQ